MTVATRRDTTRPHESFEAFKAHPIPLLNLTVEEYRHKVTGARHIHLATDDPHNVFLVAFLTVPQDSKGVAHILEHTALCGSRQYPVRDPFFMMIRRSLNTFMNAFTAGDWTAYPFSTLNKKDFDNLLSVYLDAAFFPRLDPLDFAQEGHRVEFEEIDNPESSLMYKGVVFNEMKGSMSAPTSRLAQAFQSALFPTITYHHNSGGDPAAITDLTHEDLVAFHHKHYHPSNALFFTYGDISAAEHQAKFEAQVLHEFTALDVHDLRVPDEQRYQSPQTFTCHYPLDAKDMDGDNTYVVLGWLLEAVTDIESMFENQLLEAILLDNSASPLLHALEQTDLGSSPSPYLGFDGNTRESTFIAGLQGCKTENAEQIEKLILETLQQVVEDGVPSETIEAMLHQFELSQREVSGGSFPYGLQIIMEAIGTSIHHGDAAEVLDLDPQLTKLREKTKNSRYLPELIQRKLLDNPHRVRVVMSPDSELAQRENDAELAKVSSIADRLSESDKADIIAQAKALINRQAQQDDPDILPKVTLNDVAKTRDIPESKRIQIGNIPTEIYAAGTNGLLYQKAIMPLPPLSEKQLAWLPLYTILFAELGTIDKSYLEVQTGLAADVGSLGMSMMIRPNTEHNNQTEGYLSISAKALASKQAAASHWMKGLWQNTTFSEHQRIREILQQIRANKLNSIVGSGHAYAMGAASAGHSSLAAQQLAWDGIGAALHYKNLGNNIESDAYITELAEILQSIHDAVKQQPIQLMSVAEAATLDSWTAIQPPIWQDIATTTLLENPISIDTPTSARKTAWHINSQVNYVSIAYPTVPANHADAPALHVLAGYLRNTRLHTLIREQGGAYGGGASYASDLQSFRYYSYRDPRTQGTIDDFLASSDWMQTHAHESAALEEAILGVIASIDKPSSPAGEAIGDYFSELFGATAEKRQALRQKILAVSVEDLQRVAATYLTPDNAHIAVLGSTEAMQALGEKYQHFQL